MGGPLLERGAPLSPVYSEAAVEEGHHRLRRQSMLSDCSSIGTKKTFMSRARRRISVSSTTMTVSTAGWSRWAKQQDDRVQGLLEQLVRHTFAQNSATSAYLGHERHAVHHAMADEVESLSSDGDEDEYDELTIEEVSMEVRAAMAKLKSHRFLDVEESKVKERLKGIGDKLLFHGRGRVRQRLLDMEARLTHDKTGLSKGYALLSLLLELSYRPLDRPPTLAPTIAEKAEEEAAVSEGAMRRRRRSFEEEEGDRAMARLEAKWRQELLEATDEEEEDEEEEEEEWEGRGEGERSGEGEGEGTAERAMVATRGPLALVERRPQPPAPPSPYGHTSFSTLTPLGPSLPPPPSSLLSDLTPSQASLQGVSLPGSGSMVGVDVHAWRRHPCLLTPAYAAHLASPLPPSPCPSNNDDPSRPSTEDDTLPLLPSFRYVSEGEVVRVILQALGGHTHPPSPCPSSSPSPPLLFRRVSPAHQHFTLSLDHPSHPRLALPHLTPRCLHQLLTRVLCHVNTLGYLREFAETIGPSAPSRVLQALAEAVHEWLQGVEGELAHREAQLDRALKGQVVEGGGQMTILSLLTGMRDRLEEARALATMVRQGLGEEEEGVGEAGRRVRAGRVLSRLWHVVSRDALASSSAHPSMSMSLEQEGAAQRGREAHRRRRRAGGERERDRDGPRGQGPWACSGGGGGPQAEEALGCVPAASAAPVRPPLLVSAFLRALEPYRHMALRWASEGKGGGAQDVFGEFMALGEGVGALVVEQAVPAFLRPLGREMEDLAQDVATLRACGVRVQEQREGGGREGEEEGDGREERWAQGREGGCGAEGLGGLFTADPWGEGNGFSEPQAGAPGSTALLPHTTALAKPAEPPGPPCPDAYTYLTHELEARLLSPLSRRCQAVHRATLCALLGSPMHLPSYLSALCRLFLLTDRALLSALWTDTLFPSLLCGKKKRPSSATLTAWLHQALATCTCRRRTSEGAKTKADAGAGEMDEGGDWVWLEPFRPLRSDGDEGGDRTKPALYALGIRGGRDEEEDEEEEEEQGQIGTRASLDSLGGSEGGGRGQEDAVGFLGGLTVTWRLPWPLSRVITAEHMDAYARLLRLPLQVLFVRQRLEGLCRERVHWTSRLSAAHFVVTALDEHLGLHTCHHRGLRELCAAMRAATSVGAVCHLHSLWVCGLEERGLLCPATRSLHQHLTTLLQLINALADATCPNTDHPTGTGGEEEEAYALVVRQLGVVNALLDHLLTSRLAPGVEGLALRLNFNDFFNSYAHGRRPTR